MIHSAAFLSKLLKFTVASSNFLTHYHISYYSKPVLALDIYIRELNIYSFYFASIFYIVLFLIFMF